MVNASSLLLLAAVGGFFALAWLGYLSLMRKARRAVMPLVAREHWTNAEYREHERKLAERDRLAGAGSLTWQAHNELKRMTDTAANLATKLVEWRRQHDAMTDEATLLEEQAAQALQAGDEAKARALVLNRRATEARQQAVARDIADSEATLDRYRREIAALENRLGDDMRRESIANARIAGARDTIRARQLLHGTLAEAAMAKLEEKEWCASVAEAEVEAYDMTTRPALDREIEALEVETELDRLKSRKA